MVPSTASYHCGLLVGKRLPCNIESWYNKRTLFSAIYSNLKSSDNYVWWMIARKMNVCSKDTHTVPLWINKFYAEWCGDKMMIWWYDDEWSSGQEYCTQTSVANYCGPLHLHFRNLQKIPKYTEMYVKSMHILPTSFHLSFCLSSINPLLFIVVPHLSTNLVYISSDIESQVN